MPTRKPFQRERDLETIGNLYLQGWSQHRIVEKLNQERDYELTQQTISNDLKEIQKRWQANTVMPLDTHKQKELARIDKLEEHYWQEYMASKEPRKITSKAAKSKPGKPDAKGNATSQLEQTGTERIEQREGNPAFLQGVERCIKLRCDLLGLNAPQKFKTEDWRTQAIEDIKAGRLKYADVASAFDDTLALELFRLAGKAVMVSDDTPELPD